MEVTPEIEAHHHKHTGHWVDYLLGGAALLVSVISLYLGMHNAEHMERMVAAASYPEVHPYSTNVDTTLKLFLLNEGVGPGRIKHVSLAYNGQPIANTEALLAAMAPQATPEQRADVRRYLVTSSIVGRLLPAKEQIAFFDLAHLPPSHPLRDTLRDGIGNAEVSVCYCSLFHECYSREPGQMEPTVVKACPTTPSYKL